MYGSIEEKRQEDTERSGGPHLWLGASAALVLVLSLLTSSIYWAGSTPRLFLADVFGAASGKGNNRTTGDSSTTITNFVSSGSAGAAYATMQNSKVSSTIRTNQDEWLHLPQGGWRLAPHNFESLSVAQSHMWGTSCLVLDDGTCARSKTSSLDWWVSDANKKGLLQDQLLTREEPHDVAVLSAAIKSRRPSSSPTPFPTAPSPVPTARPTKSSPPSFQPSSSPTPAPSTAKPSALPTPSPTAPPSPEPTSATVASNSETLYAPADDGMLAEQILIALCRPGTRHNSKARGAEPTCVPCAAGFYSKSYGASKCSPCPKGGYSSAGSSLCSLQLPFHGLMDTPLPLTAPTTQYFDDSASFPAPLGALLGVVDLPPTYFYTLDLYLTGVQTARTVLLQGVGGNSSCWFAKGSCEARVGHSEVPRLSLVPDTLQLEINLASDSDALLGVPTAGGNGSAAGSVSAPTPQPSWTPIKAISQPLLLNRWQTVSVSVTQDVVSVTVTDSLTGQLVVRPLAVDWRRDEPLAGVRLFSGVDPLSSDPVLPPASSMRNLFICESMGACTCPAGSFRSSRSLECTLCPPGSFSAVTNTATSCSPCPSGLYSSVSGAVTCLACAAGMESSATEGSTQCVCPAGSAPTPASSSSSGSACSLCPANTYAGRGSDACSPCPRRTVSSAGSSKCVCRHGLVESSADKTTSCVPCAVGTYAVNSSLSKTDTCAQCPAGYYGSTLFLRPSANDTNTPAAIGVRSTSSTLEPHCNPCGANFYSAAGGALNCTACPPYSRSKPGSTECKCIEGYTTLGLSSGCYSSVFVFTGMGVALAGAIMFGFYHMPALGLASNSGPYQFLPTTGDGSSEHGGQFTSAHVRAIELANKPGPWTGKKLVVASPPR